jgi:hypothetical protein
MKISIILLAYKETEELFQQQMNALCNQDVVPSEVVLVDTSAEQKFKHLFNLVDTTFDKQYISSPGSYPGEGRNIGIKKASNEMIAFLDMKTIPCLDWIQVAVNSMRFYKSDYIFGSTVFEANSSFQRVYKFCTYGNAAHETLPGTIIKKSFFKKVGDFISFARAAEDIEWRNRVKSVENTVMPNKPLLVYKDLPKNSFELIIKYVRNSFYGAILDVLKNIKEAYLSLFIILIFLLIPRWNYLLSDWNLSPFYIDDITKKIYFSLLLLFVGYYSLNKIFLKQQQSNLYTVLKYLSYLIVFYSIYRWNELLGEVSLSISLYIPHITKLFLASVLLASIVNRGIIIPLNNKVSYDQLFPFYWLRVGLLGCILDLLKAPIYIFGSFFALLKR